MTTRISSQPRSQSTQRPDLPAPAVQKQEKNPVLSAGQKSPTSTTAEPVTSDSRPVEQMMQATLRKRQIQTAQVSPTNAGVTFPVAPNPASPSQAHSSRNLLRDSHLNGRSFDRMASNANPRENPVIVVNGIDMPIDRATAFAHEMSRLTGAPARLVYNCSCPAVAASAAVTRYMSQAWRRAEGDFRRLPPMSQAALISAGKRDEYINARTMLHMRAIIANPATAKEVKDYLLQNPPAARTQANMILSQLLPEKPNEMPRTNGPAVRVIGYSQGAAISAQALRMVRQELVQRYGSDIADGLLRRVHVLTLGGAANANDFPAAVNVTSVAHQGDIVSQYFGANRQAFSLRPTENPLRFFQNMYVQHVNYFDFGTHTSDFASRRAVQNWAGNTMSFQPQLGDYNIILPDFRR